jgi:4-amino-4-deoxy-L-arabinose transferase-like glycosyltransferase
MMVMNSVAEFLFKKKVKVIAVFFTTLLFIVAVFYKCGRLPVASYGDEVWGAESGYFLLKQGTLKWPMFDNSIGNGERTYWPPVVAIVQAINFYLFGLNSYSLMLQSLYMSLLLVLATYFCLKQMGHSRVDSLAGGILLFVSMLIERRYSTGRMENWLPVCFLVFCGLIYKVQKREKSIQSYILAGLAGFLIGIGSVSYYPQTPFFLLSCIAVVIHRKFDLKAGFVILLGFSVIVFAWLFWMNFDLSFLYKELSTYKGQNKDASGFSIFTKYTLGIEVVVLLVIILSVFFFNKKINLFGICFLVFCTGLFYLNPITLCFPVVLGILSVYQLLTEIEKKHILYVVQYVACGVVILKFSGIIYLAYVQREVRDYNQLVPKFEKYFDKDCVVGFTQSAWLGLRMVMGQGEIHFMIPSGSPQSYVFRSEKLKNSAGVSTFTHFIIDPRMIGDIKKDYPAVASAIAKKTFVPVEKIDCTNEKMPLSAVPYRFVVYKKIVQ